jgi:hypothetical protein
MQTREPTDEITKNPLQDITAVRHVVFVMKGGKVFENLARGSKTSDAPR